ncbi:MAG: sugar phosphate nucleotidyltransferase [Myxococcota bacterium]|nr:sugar phosphate nucleotidyltransferase [Myxococcota bacterium]
MVKQTAKLLPNELTAVIPAAGKIPEGVLTLTNVKSPALIPVAGRPVIDWTIRYLRQLGVENFVIAVSETGTFLEDFVECSFGDDLNIEFVVPERDGGVGFTLLELLRRVQTRGSLVVLGDTHFEFNDTADLFGDSPYVLTGPVQESKRWCIAKLNEEGLVESLHDKESDLTGPLHALIGVYGFPNTRNALEAAEDAAKQCTRPEDRIELSHILMSVAEKSKQSIIAMPAAKWIDVGNPDRHASSHRTLLQARAFNQLEIDPVFGLITKRSTDSAKFISQINYQRLLPSELSILFPRFVDYSVNWDAPFVKMEYYGYPTLAEVFLFANVDPVQWEQIFQHLIAIVTEGFMKYRRPISASTIWNMYIEKTESRLASADIGPELRELIDHDGSFTINGKPVANLKSRWEEVKSLVAHWHESSEASIIHGDLCLSNILYDVRSRVCKLIDPRGSFKVDGIYGDPKYDIAKLYHSVYGLYDFIVNDVFDLRIDGTDIEFKMRARPQHKVINTKFEKVFFPTFDKKETLLRTALLFASMPALHYDAPKRQLAMYIRSLQLLDEALSL